jgi:hypothetical protein
VSLAHQLLPPKWMGRECYPAAGDWLSNVGVQGVKVEAYTGNHIARKGDRTP